MILAIRYSLLSIRLFHAASARAPFSGAVIAPEVLISAISSSL
jgi:hypothetical protein